MNRLLALLLCLPAWAGACEPPADEVLQAVNALRTHAAVPALAWSEPVSGAARQHAQDLARRGVLSHLGPNGQQADQRLAEAGYAHALWAENVARGQPELATVLQRWLASPGHRRNLLLADARHLGLACAQAAPASPRYWVLVVAAPL